MKTEKQIMIKKPLFSVFVLPQSSRCGDDILVSAVGAAAVAAIVAADFFIVIAGVVAKSMHKIKCYGIMNTPKAT